MDNQALQIIKESGVEQQTAKMLQEAFSPYFDAAGTAIEESKGIIVTDISQKEKMARARELRLILKNERVSADKKRKELKEDSLRYGKAVQGIYNVLDFLIAPTEKYLEDQEKFAEREEEKKINAIRIKRQEECATLIEFIPMGIDVGIMSEADYGVLLTGAKLQLQARLDYEKKVADEAAKKAKEEEEQRAKIKEENEKLKAEAEAREKAIAREREENLKKLKAEAEAREKAIAEKNAIEEKQRKEQEEKDAKEKAQKEAERKAQNAPDKDKIVLFISNLSLLAYPDVKSDDAKKIIDIAKLEISKIASILSAKVNGL